MRTGNERRTTVRLWAGAAGAMALLAACAGASPLPEGLHVRVRAAAGYDTNALRLHQGTVDAGFAPYAFDVTYEVRPEPRSRARLESRLQGAIYANPAPAGRNLQYDLGLRLTRRLVGGRLRRTEAMALDLEFFPYFGVKRSVYVSRRTGRDILVTETAHDGLPQRRVSLAGRYDSRVVGGEGTLALHWPRRTVWDLEYEFQSRNYTQDYPFVQRSPQRPLARYDYEDWALRLRVARELPARFSARLRYWHERKRYIDRAARDFTGAPILEAGYVRNQRFVYDVVHGEVRWQHRAVDAALACGWTRRDDPAWGYFDSNTLSIGPSVRVQRGAFEVQAAYEYAHRDFANAHVGFNNLRPLLDDYPRTAAAAVEYRAAANASIFATLEFDNVNEANPVFSYRRLRGSLGSEIRY